MKQNMKKRMAALVLALLLLAASAAAAETKISVTGTGETRVAADTAVITLGVNARDREVQKAQQAVNERIAAIRKALADQGIPEENINTDFMNIYAIYDYEKDQEQVQAYNASSTLAIKVEKIDSAGSVIDAAFAAGANTLNGISFSAEDTKDAERTALEEAVAAAKEKAEIIAGAAGMKITGIELISEGGTFTYGNSVSNFAKARGGTEEAAMDFGTVVQAAKLVISASVTVNFTAE